MQQWCIPQFISYYKHTPNNAHFHPIPQLFLIHLFCLFACWIRSHVCIAPSNFCFRAPGIQPSSQFITRQWQRPYIVSCPTPLYYPCKTRALLWQKDKEEQMDEGRAGWTVSHPAHCPCTGLLVHHHHKHGTTQQCPSCPSTCKSHHSLQRSLSTAITSLPKERHRKHGAMSQSPCSPSHLYHILAIHAAGTRWLSTKFYYFSDMRRKHTVPAGAADRINYSCKLESTEKLKKVDPQHGWVTFQGRTASHVHSPSPSRDSLHGRSSSQF